jgi:hypothetical protein
VQDKKVKDVAFLGKKECLLSRRGMLPAIDWMESGWLSRYARLQVPTSLIIGGGTPPLLEKNT